MTHKLKGLSLALLVALAIGTIAAPMAAGADHNFTSSAFIYVLTGTNEQSTKSKFTVTGTKALSIECTDAHLEGTQAGASVDLITLHPTYASCQTGPFPISVAANTGGCNYVFDSDTTGSAHSSSDQHATTTIECETMLQEESKHTHVITFVTATIGGKSCTMEIASTHPAGTIVNASLHGMRYINLTSHGSGSKEAVTFKWTVKTIHTKVTGALCSTFGVPEGTYSASYEGESEVTGYEYFNQPGGSTTNGRTWSHGPQVDFTVD